MRKIFKITLYLFLGFVVLDGNLSYAQIQDIRLNPFLPQLPPKKEEPPPVVEQRPQDSSQDRESSRSSQQFTPEQPQEIVIQPPELKISGLIWNTNRPQAIVNGRVVDVGDKLNAGDQAQEIKIVSIAKEGIEVEFSGKNFNVSP